MRSEARSSHMLRICAPIFFFLYLEVTFLFFLCGATAYVETILKKENAEDGEECALGLFSEVWPRYGDWNEGDSIFLNLSTLNLSCR